MKFRLLLFLSILISFYSLNAQSKKIDSLKAIIAAPGEDTGKVNAYRFLIGMVIRQDPRLAIQYGKKGIALGKKLDFVNGLGGCYVNTAAAFTAASHLDSTLLYLDSSITYARRLYDPNRLALIYLNRADAYMQLRNLSRSLQDCDTALFYAEAAQNDDRIGRIYQTIGSVYYIQNNFSQSTVYYEKALGYYRKIGNDQIAAVVLNNLGNVYKHIGDSPRAIEYFTKALKIADSLDDANNLSLYYGNLSDVYLGMKDFAMAEKMANMSMEYARMQENEAQVAIAFGHLGETYLGQGRLQLAASAARQSYDISTKNEDLPWRQTSADLLAEIYSKTGDYAQAYQFEKISKELNDSLIRQQFDEDIASMQTAFRVEEKDKEIQLLNLDSEVRRAQLQRQRMILFTVIILLVLTIAGVVLLINRNRLRQRMKELELRNRIAADLHDEVGSSLSSIHVLSRMANQREGSGAYSPTLEKISGNAKETMDRMSDIVWAIHPENDSMEQLLIRMKEFAADILEPLDIRYEFKVQGDLAKQRLGINQRRDLYLVFKEAINNAAKYSNCKNVLIELMQDGSHFHLVITDDGNGFVVQENSTGNGLRNMRQRAIQMGGTLEIESETGKGTRIQLSVPA